VSLSPAVSVILRDLGVEATVVGRHGYEMVLSEFLPVCGDQAGIDLERLIAVNPDLVITQWGRRSLPERLQTMATKHGWQLHDAVLLSLDDIRREVPALSHLVRQAGGPDSSAQAAALAAEMDRAWSIRGAGFRGAGRVLLLADAAPPSVLGPGSFHHQILEAIGGLPAVSAGNAFQELTSEDVVALAPDAIILIMPRSPGAPPRASGPHTPQEALLLLGNLGVLDIPAVTTKRVAVIDDPLAHTPSTAMIALADEMAKVLAGWSPQAK